MCQMCEKKPVYEFTNQQKLCARCFVRYFQKKFLYIVRKFKMIRQGDIIGYENKGDFKGVVLEDVLNMFSEKAVVELVKVSISHKTAPPNSLPDLVFPILPPSKAWKLKLSKSKSSPTPTKFAITSNLDFEADKIVHELIKGKGGFKKVAPVEGKIIKPLYLFLDKEILLYAKIKKLKYKEKKMKLDKVSEFVNKLEEKHPEIKRAIVNSYLELFPTL